MVNKLTFKFVDHHCPWVGTCVGKRNHKFFASFLLYCSIHALFTLGTGLYVLIKSYIANFAANLPINFPTWITTIYAALMVLVLFPFGLYHFGLICLGKTTNEEVRGKY